jgi:class 3 adenylate cyclase/CRP-like cAMP-binding protein
MNVLEHFRKPTKVLTLAPGTVLFRAGEAADAMYVLLEGSADILVGSMVVEVAEPGSLLGELALVDAGERSAGVVARTECRVVRITVAEFDLLVREAPAFSRVVMKLMAERLRRMNENLGELEKRIFHLKALYDLSREIGLLSGTESVTDNLLMMVLGTFGVERGLIVLRDARSNQVQRFAHRGIDDADAVAHTLAQHHVAQPLPSVDLHICIPFDVDQGLKGSIGLGEKLTGDDYTPEDSELLLTLANQGAVAIRNARAHEEVVRYAKELADSLRRIQILESMKTSLAKFVPKTVQDLIEKSPEAPVLEPREADVSVLFADITGYSRLTSSMAPERLNQLVELYFAAFLDEILRRGGDVNETAGDGLMVIFQDPNPKQHAEAAVQTALAILQRTNETNATLEGYYEPVAMHIGVNSGMATVGARKIEGASAERWTYTATGTTTNIAARLAALAESGTIVLSEETRRRLGDEVELVDLGPQSLKNIAMPVRAYRCSLPVEARA